MIQRFNDVDSIRLARRTMQFQREWLDLHAAHLDEMIRELEERERNMGEENAMGEENT
jgi:hypothetical protein